MAIISGKYHTVIYLHCQTNSHSEHQLMLCSEQVVSKAG